MRTFVPNPDIPVHNVYNEADRSFMRTLHRNHLLLIGRASNDRSDTPGAANDQQVTSKRWPAPKPRQRTPDATDQGEQSAGSKKKAHLPPDAEDEAEAKDEVVDEVHEKENGWLPGRRSGSDTHCTGMEQRWQQRAPRGPDDGPGSSAGARHANRGGDDRRSTDAGGARLRRAAADGDGESAEADAESMDDSPRDETGKRTAVIPRRSGRQRKDWLIGWISQTGREGLIF